MSEQERASEEYIGADGLGLIAQERRRQIQVEGWSPEHDDQHDIGQIARAAVCYAMPPDLRAHVNFYGDAAAVPEFWPWDDRWWKPGQHQTTSERIRELVKAGALIAAEIDRLQRVMKGRAR